MAGECEDAVERVGNLIATVHWNSMYCVVQACSSHHTANTAADIPVGIHVFSPWRLAYGERQLQACDTFIRVCASPNAKLPGALTLCCLTGKLPADHLAMCE